MNFNDNVIYFIEKLGDHFCVMKYDLNEEKMKYYHLGCVSVSGISGDTNVFNNLAKFLITNYYGFEQDNTYEFGSILEKEIGKQSNQVGICGLFIREFMERKYGGRKRSGVI